MAWRAALIVWLALALWCLLYSEYVVGLNEPDAYKDADTFLIVVMFALSFPAAYIGVGLTFLYSIIFLQNRATGPSDLIFMWTAFAVIGYWQSFKVVPWLYKKLFRRGTTAV